MKKTLATALSSVLLAGVASAAIPHFEGFEDPSFTQGAADNWNNSSGGEILRVASGTAGITSSTGTGHAIITNLVEGTDVFDQPSLGASGPFTRFGGYSSTFVDGYSTSLDVYLDPAWSAGSGFDFSSASSKQDGNHLRDFVWHVGVDGTDLLVNASNNTDFNFNAFKLNNENAGDNYTVTSAGWYTLQTVYNDEAGSLSVDFNLIDASDNTVYSVTRTTTDSIDTTVGGNRYGWLTYNNIDGLAIDNTAVIPEPTSIALLGLGGLLVARRRRSA